MAKILMYTTNKIYAGKRITGGIKRFLMLYNGLVSKNYDVDLYCADDEESLKSINPQAKSINSKINENKRILFPNITLMIKNHKLLKLLKKRKYDHVIVFDVPTAISLSLLNFKNIQLFLRQDLIEYRKITISNKNSIYKFIYLQFMKFCEYICCKKANKIILQCQYDLDNLVARHKLIKNEIMNKSNIQINNINAPWIVEKSKKSSKSSYQSDKFKIGFIGDFSNARKGHQILLPAVNNVNKDNNSVETYIIGDGKDLEKYQEEYKNNQNIKFLGRLENPLKVLKNMDLIVVPSLADSCPNTVLEAMYNDVLVIGSNAGGIPEIIQNEYFLFETTTHSLEEKIKDIIKSKDKKDFISIQNKRKKELTFNWEDKIINIITK